MSSTDPVLSLQLAVRALVAANFPGDHAVEVRITLNSTERPVRIFMPSPAVIPSSPVPAAGGDDGEWRPTPFQMRILDALDGCALHADALVDAMSAASRPSAVLDRRELYRKPHGIAELQEKGMVHKHPRLGYYRPDSPPATIGEA